MSLPWVERPADSIETRSEAASTWRRYSTTLGQGASFLSSPTRCPRNFSGLGTWAARAAPASDRTARTDVQSSGRMRRMRLLLRGEKKTAGSLPVSGMAGDLLLLWEIRHRSRILRSAESPVRADDPLDPSERDIGRYEIQESKIRFGRRSGRPPAPRSGRVRRGGPGRRGVPLSLAVAELRGLDRRPVPPQPGGGGADVQAAERPFEERAPDHVFREQGGRVLPLRLHDGRAHSPADPGLERLLLARGVEGEDLR